MDGVHGYKVYSKDKSLWDFLISYSALDKYYLNFREDKDCLGLYCLSREIGTIGHMGIFYETSPIDIGEKYVELNPSKFILKATGKSIKKKIG